MSDTIQNKGQCLCGSVRFTVEQMSTKIDACHCPMCRQWGGGPLFATEFLNHVSFDGEENIRVYNSSAWAERGFCKKCGTHLFYRLKESRAYSIPAGLCEDQEKFVFTTQLFIDKKPSFYHFGNETQVMTEEEILEKFVPLLKEKKE